MATLSHLDRAIQVLKPYILDRRYQKWIEVLNSRISGTRIVLENLQDPFNGSACLRTGDGFGIQYFDIVETINNFQAYQKDSTNTGTRRWLSLDYHKSTRSCIENLKQKGYVTLGASLEEGSLGLKEVLKKLKRVGKLGEGEEKFPKIALIFGNEQRGISKSLHKHCDYIYNLEMLGFAQSFNINVSLAVSLTILKEQGVLNNFKKNQGANEGVDGGNRFSYPLEEEEKKRILLSWLLGVTPNYRQLFERHGIELDEF